MSPLSGTQDNVRTVDSECTLCSCQDTDLSSTKPNVNPECIGDVILHFLDSDAALDFRYRCSRDLLRRASAYFEVLFDPTKFQEGREVERSLYALSKIHPDIASLPVDALPVVVIKGIGDISAKDSHRQPALRLFLKIIQEPKRGSTEADEWIKSSVHTLSLTASLAIIADRFEAKEMVAKCIKRMEKRLFDDGKRDRGPRQKEIHRRKRLLIGILLGFPDWVRLSSAALICEGSECWTRTFPSTYAEEPEGNNESLWWRLPGGMEEELQYRRECVLETISSLPSHFIDLYTGKQLQCKLGYDTSPACDCYQLGQMVRFFTRKGLLRTQSTYVPTDEYPLYAGEVTKVLDNLRQCPSYQLDNNHHHCGLRTRLLPLLDSLWPNGQVGVCLNCWNATRDTESWFENPARGVWVFSKTSIMRWETCLQHNQLKAMYTADERSWTPSPS